MNATIQALMARGVDFETAETLRKQNWTLKRLKHKDEAELSALGLSRDFIRSLLNEERPPIPPDTVVRLLFRNRYQCCVCRDPNRSVIIHHIDEWATSRSHDETNLTVLCLEHHGEAHTKRDLAKNLDAKALRALKEQWEAVCREFDARSILDASKLQHVDWLYFNHRRLFQLARSASIDPAKMRSFPAVLERGLVDREGDLNPHPDNLSYMYAGPHTIVLSRYVEELMLHLLAKVTVINLSDHLDKSLVLPLLVEGDLIFVYGLHFFKQNPGAQEGIGQIVRGRRRANGVMIEFVFDRWEATSGSAWGLWLTGSKAVGSLIRVKSLCRENGDVKILGTVLSISHGHKELQTRYYGPNGAFMYRGDDSDEDDDVDDSEDFTNLV